MRNTITSVALAITLLFSSVVPAVPNDDKQEVCITLAEIHKTVAESRDKGIEAKVVFYVLVTSGLPQSIAETVVITVYSNPEMSGEDFLRDFYNFCMGQPA